LNLSTKPEDVIFLKTQLIFLKKKFAEVDKIINLATGLYPNYDFNIYRIPPLEIEKSEDQIRDKLRGKESKVCLHQEIIRSIESNQREKFNKLFEITKILINNKEFGEKTDLFYEKAYEFYKKSEFGPARDAIQVAYTVDPKDLDTIKLWGMIEFTMGNNAAAIDLFSKVINKDKKNSNAYYRRHQAKERNKGDWCLLSRWDLYKAADLDHETFSKFINKGILVEDCLKIAQDLEGDNLIKILNFSKYMCPEDQNIRAAIRDVYSRDYQDSEIDLLEERDEKKWAKGDTPSLFEISIKNSMLCIVCGLCDGKFV
jgi:tetratricopeptide (TPR) repeat protein